MVKGLAKNTEGHSDLRDLDQLKFGCIFCPFDWDEVEELKYFVG